jgi:hypothetical protein
MVTDRVPLWRWENLPEGQPSLHHSTNQTIMVEWLFKKKIKGKNVFGEIVFLCFCGKGMGGSEGLLTVNSC